MDEAGCGVVLFLAVLAFIAMPLACYDYGYKDGQIDAAEGRWKYTPTTQRTYVEVER